MNENECADGYPNNCHRHAVCTDTEGSYTCTCKDGYRDLNPNDEPGTLCAQINECMDADPPLNDCNMETHVCLDRPPPLKWLCVERTPAPTPSPTPTPFLCYNDKTDDAVDIGCTIDTPLCLASTGTTGGTVCAVCINDVDVVVTPDTGCDVLTPYCIITDSSGVLLKVPDLNEPGNACGGD